MVASDSGNSNHDFRACRHAQRSSKGNRNGKNKNDDDNWITKREAVLGLGDVMLKINGVEVGKGRGSLSTEEAKALKGCLSLYESRFLVYHTLTVVRRHVFEQFVSKTCDNISEKNRAKHERGEDSNLRVTTKRKMIRSRPEIKLAAEEQDELNEA